MNMKDVKRMNYRKIKKHRVSEYQSKNTHAWQIKPNKKEKTTHSHTNGNKSNSSSTKPNEENNYFHATWRRIVRMPCMSTYFHDLNGSSFPKLRYFLHSLIFIITTTTTTTRRDEARQQTMRWNYVLFIAHAIDCVRELNAKLFSTWEKKRRTKNHHHTKLL